MKGWSGLMTMKMMKILRIRNIYCPILVIMLLLDELKSIKNLLIRGFTVKSANKFGSRTKNQLVMSLENGKKDQNSE